MPVGCHAEKERVYSAHFQCTLQRLNDAELNIIALVQDGVYLLREVHGQEVLAFNTHKLTNVFHQL